MVRLAVQCCFMAVLVCDDFHMHSPGTVDHEVEHDRPIGAYKTFDHEFVHVKFFPNLWPFLAELLWRCVVVRDKFADHDCRGGSAHGLSDGGTIAGGVWSSA